MATRNPSRRSRRPPGGARGSRRALLVAINDYGSPQNNLPSCLQDAARFRSVLQSRYGFETFAELYDGDASIANVESGLAWLFENVADDDRLVFFYSGHGYQQPRDGVLDECLVLSHLEFLFDDRLSELSQSAPPGVLTVVLDSCFSGGMEKRIPFGDGVEIARTKLWVPPPDASPAKSLAGGPLVPRPFGCFPVTDPNAVKRLVLGTPAGAGLKAAAPQAAGAEEVSQLHLNGLLLSACSENETASAATSTTEGLSAFTYALMKTLPASGEISVASLHEGVRARLAEGGFRQTPILKAPAGAADLANTSFVTLAPLAAAAGQPAKALPPEPGGDSTTDLTTEDPAMTDQQAYDQQFWRTVERVAAQVALAAGNAPAEGKSFAPPSRPGFPPPGNGQEGEPAVPTTRPANPTTLPAGTASGPNGGAASPAPGPGEPGPGAAAGEEKWVRAALTIAGMVAPAVIDAFRKRPKDFAPDQDAERMAESVSEVVAPAIVDAIASQPESGDGAGADKFWGAVARVVASAVPSIVAEFTRGKDADPAAGEQKGAVLAAVVGAAAWHAIAAWRGKSTGGPGGAAGDDGELSRAATRVAAEVVPAVVRELTGQNGQTGQKMILPAGMQLPVPGRYYIM